MMNAVLERLIYNLYVGSLPRLPHVYLVRPMNTAAHLISPCIARRVTRVPYHSQPTTSLEGVCRFDLSRKIS